MDFGKILNDMKIKIPGVDMTDPAMTTQVVDAILDVIKDEPWMPNLMEFSLAAASPPGSQPQDYSSLSASERVQ